jgi:hydroxyacylglutathione hydrolase
MELAPNLHGFFWASASVNNCNSYLLRTPEKAILTDPGHASCFDHVSQGLEELGLTVADVDLIIATHAHPDHLEAVQLFDRDATLFALHEADWDLLKSMLPASGASPSLDTGGLEPDFFLGEGELKVGDITLEVFHTPGHSPGSVTFYWPSVRALFTGDLIFRGGLGRTDTPGGDSEELKSSIRRMAGLEAEWLLPGHGEAVWGRDAVKANFSQVESTWFGYL